MWDDQKVRRGKNQPNVQQNLLNKNETLGLSFDISFELNFSKSRFSFVQHIF